MLKSWRIDLSEGCIKHALKCYTVNTHAIVDKGIHLARLSIGFKGN